MRRVLNRPRAVRVDLLAGSYGGHVLHRCGQGLGTPAELSCATRRMVPEISQRFFPNMALGFDDPRVQVHITDGIKWVQVGQKPRLYIMGYRRSPGPGTAL